MTKCLVKGCNNHKHQGKFVVDLCSPCYNMLTSGNIAFGETFIHTLKRERYGYKEALVQVQEVADIGLGDI